MDRLLIISVSPLRQDPRVLRQIDLFKDRYEVITMGYGPSPDGVKKHVRLPRPAPTTALQKFRKALGALLGKHVENYQGFPGIWSAQDWLRTHSDEFDAVLVNDLGPLPVAVGTGKPTHADLHEYALGQHTNWLWRKYQLPVLEYCAEQLKRASSTTAVSAGIAALYDDQWDTHTKVVANTPHYQDGYRLLPTGRPIRLVYMGVGREVRSLDLPIEAVKRVNAARPGALTLDMYLAEAEAGYLEKLRLAAGDSSRTGVRINDPVPANEMISTLSQFDVAVVFFPPKTLNLKFTLPNKFFEAVQARIGVVTGPSPEMVPYLERFGFGEATTGWTVDDLAQTLGSLTPEKVDQWKAAADSAAADLSSDEQDAVWAAAVSALFASNSASDASSDASDGK